MMTTHTISDLLAAIKATFATGVASMKPGSVLPLR